MMIELIRPWRRFAVGHTFAPPEGVGNLLVRRGVARLTATAGHADTTSLRSPAHQGKRHKKKGRRRHGPR